MAIFTNLAAKEVDKHGLFESSNLWSTDIGSNFSVIVRDTENGNKPIFLDTKRIDRPLPKGAVPQV